MVDILEVPDEERNDGKTTETQLRRNEADHTDYDPCQETVTILKDCRDLKCVCVYMGGGGGGVVREIWIYPENYSTIDQLASYCIYM